MTLMTGSITAGELRDRLIGGGELALLDAREQGVYHRSHLFHAACVPLSHLELLLNDLVPRRSTPIVWCDEDGAVDGLAARAASRAAELGWTDNAVLAGGATSWAAAGGELYSGVNVPSKAFGEYVEHAFDTPRLPAAEVKALLDAAARGEADIVVLDSPTARRVPPDVHPDRDRLPRSGARPSGQGDGTRPRDAGDRELCRPHPQHHRRPVADQCQVGEPGRRARERHDGLGTRRLRRCARRRRPRPRPRTRCPGVGRGCGPPTSARASASTRARRARSTSWAADTGRTTYLLDVRTPRGIRGGPRRRKSECAGRPVGPRRPTNTSRRAAPGSS